MLEKVHASCDDLWYDLKQYDFGHLFTRGLRISETATASYVVQKITQERFFNNSPRIQGLLRHLATFMADESRGISVLDVGIKLLKPGKCDLLQSMINAGARPEVLGIQWFKLLLLANFDAETFAILLPHFSTGLDALDVERLTLMAWAQNHAGLFGQICKFYNAQMPMEYVERGNQIRSILSPGTNVTTREELLRLHHARHTVTPE